MSGGDSGGLGRRGGCDEDAGRCDGGTGRGGATEVQGGAARHD